MSRTGLHTTPLLARAAQSIAENMGLEDTMVDVLRARAFQPYAEGLRQYLIIRLGSEEEGSQAFLELKAAVAGSETRELLDPPGIRANLYLLARAIVKRHWEEGDGAARPAASALPWRQPGLVSDAYLLALSRLRKELPTSDGELLELRFARELEPPELAHVLSIAPDKVEMQLEMALAAVRRLLGGPWKDPGKRLDKLLLEAFAIRPSATAEADGGLARARPLEAGMILGGRYAIEKQVGSGGMGTVYRASDTEVPGHVVALKLLHHPALSEAARAAALRELHLIASVFHPSVVQFKDHGWHEDRLWFVMPWYEGESLQTRIDRAPLTRAEARPLFAQLALALATMHSAGIRHQDIKPDNIFLTRLAGGRAGGEAPVLPVLLDLGVAAKEAELVLAGTPIYFAPEVAAQYARVAEPHPVTPKADIFSLCLSLRNALEPGTREDVAAGAVERFIEHRAEHSPALPASEDLRFLDRYFERWLAVDPEARPAAAELADELRILTAPEDRRARRMRLLRWLAPLLLALIAVFSSIVFGLSRQAEFQKLEAARANLDAVHARNEAERARLEAAEAQEDLSAAAERQRQLEENVSKALDRYRSSELTRDQLTSKLAQTEGQLNLYRGLHTDELKRSHYLKTELDSSREEGTRLTGELESTKTQLANNQKALATQREKTLAAERRGEELDGQLRQAQQRVEDASSRINSLSVQVLALERDLDRAQEESRQGSQRVTELEAERSSLRAERDSARADLAEAQQRVDQLERQLAQLRRVRGPAPEPEQPDGGAEPQPKRLPTKRPPPDLVPPTN